jgi:hypothetical protein
MSKRLSRRQFLGAAAAVAAPTIVPPPCSASRAVPRRPTRSTSALIGCGGQGNYDLTRHMDLETSR